MPSINTGLQDYYNQASNSGAGRGVRGLASTADPTSDASRRLVNEAFGTNRPFKRDMAYLPYFEEDRARLGSMLDGRNPYAGAEWGSLIGQLQNRAMGNGPSITMDAYRQASQDNVNALGAMSRGAGTAAAARQAMIQQNRVGQGMASGLVSARNQEMIGAQGALTQALGQRDQLNQNAYLKILGAQLGLSEQQLQALLGNQRLVTEAAKQPTTLQNYMNFASNFTGGIGKMTGGGG